MVANTMTLADIRVLFASMTGYASSEEDSSGSSLKLPLCLRVSEPSGSCTYQLTGWNVSPACLVIIPVFPLCSPLTVIRTLLPIILRSRALYCSRSVRHASVGGSARCRRRASWSSMPKEERRLARASISASSSSVDFFRSDMVSITGLEDLQPSLQPDPWNSKLQSFRPTLKS